MAVGISLETHGTHGRYGTQDLCWLMQKHWRFEIFCDPNVQQICENACPSVRDRARSAAAACLVRCSQVHVNWYGHVTNGSDKGQQLSNGFTFGGIGSW